MRLGVLVEAPYAAIKSKKFPNSWRSKMKSYILLKVLHSIYYKYDVPFIFFQNRKEMRDYIQDYFRRLLK